MRIRDGKNSDPEWKKVGSATLILPQGGLVHLLCGVQERGQHEHQLPGHGGAPAEDD
jgi:hypothetical protein